MIPMNILILLVIFIILYMTGLLLTVVALINAIKDKNIPMSLISILVLTIYIIFYFALK